MIEIRFHGRGGQGAVVASQLFADAAFLEGKDVQAFPYFGVERRGAPVTAFTKIDSDKIRDKAMIYEPDIVVVLEPSLLQAVNVTEGLKEGGLVLINTEEDAKDISERLGVKNVATVGATKIALANKLGSRVQPIVNTAIVGALAKASGLVSIDSVLKAVLKLPLYADRNAEAAKQAYEATALPGGA
ncbi:MAG: 2-oxoacid:acceptor oxidoreductase family protein [Candidatus Thermoplasmatota archaeon]|nr:2-oxoacid:acceptor oxidoreductase family protein [Candidatus Thermoplasmatota archaeon]